MKKKFTVAVHINHIYEFEVESTSPENAKAKVSKMKVEDIEKKKYLVESTLDYVEVS